MGTDAAENDSQRVLRELLLLADGAQSTPPLQIVYLTSEWVASIDALVLPRLHVENAQLVVVVLKASSSDAASESSFQARNKYARVKALASSEFRVCCKQLTVACLPACIAVDTSKDVIEAASLPTNGINDGVRQLFSASTSMFHTLCALAQSQTTTGDQPQQQVSDAVLVAMRDRATTSFEQGEFVVAAKQFVDVLLRDPDCVKSNFNLAAILDMLGETYFAVHFMLHVITLDDTDSVAHTVLRYASQRKDLESGSNSCLSHSGGGVSSRTVYFQQEPEAVLAGYRSIIARFPHHVRAVHSLATLQGEAETAAPAYVREVFDELAETFEEKLVTHLEYRVPWLLVDALKKHVPSVFSEDGATSPASWRVADVGCGTGLCGRLLRPYVAHIAGVDISPLMIEKTRDAGSYDELQTDDIGPFLRKREDASLDLVISADVWIYVGALETIFTLCARKLKAQGWLVFSTELLAPDAANGDAAGGFKLAASGRFQHSEAYIAALATAHDFRIVREDAIDVRKESGEAIRGRAYLLQSCN